MSRKLFDGTNVAIYGSLGVITTLEFFQHHFAKSGHGDLLMTRQLISTNRQLLLRHVTRSVRRAAGFVQTAFEERRTQAIQHFPFRDFGGVCKVPHQG